MTVTLIGDNVNCVVTIPAKMGSPREDQMQGIWSEQLIELCGRVCYDSLGSGRPSDQYHNHLVGVGHTSVHQHVMFSTKVTDYEVESNLPGTSVRYGYVSSNLRTAIEIRRWTIKGNVIQKYDRICRELLPTVFGTSDEPSILIPSQSVKDVAVSFFIAGSRGFSHEMVRHHYECAVSQRSTRYCDESLSEYVYHPLFNRLDGRLMAEVEALESRAKDLYSRIVASLKAQGCSIKQARGAARGVLGNALDTQMIFTATVPQWLRMIKQRMTEHADAEIRMIFNQIHAVLVAGGYIKCRGTEASPDGCGTVLCDLLHYRIILTDGTIIYALATDTESAVSVAGVPRDQVASVQEVRECQA